MMEKRFMFRLAFIVSLLYFSGCALRPDLTQPLQGVSSFRSRVKNNDYGSLLEDSSPEFKRAFSTADWERFTKKMDTFGSEIGNPDNFELVSYEFSTDTVNGSLITLLYNSRISNGLVSADEFVFKEQQGTYRLFNYRFDEKLPDG